MKRILPLLLVAMLLVCLFAVPAMAASEAAFESVDAAHEFVDGYDANVGTEGFAEKLEAALSMIREE